MIRPSFHETATVPASGRLQGMRVVITEDGILTPLVRFFEQPKNSLKSLAWQSKVCSAVGLLYDYCHVMAPPNEPHRQSLYLSNFIGSLMGGTVSADGRDDLDLYWEPMSRPRVGEVLSSVSAFSDYCAKPRGMTTLNPLTEATFAERIAQYRRLDIQNETSLLRHLGSRKDFWRKASSSREVIAPRAPKISKKAPPFFPREKVYSLLTVGLKRRSSGKKYWDNFNIRDQMIVILQRYGGSRECEPMHLFVTDVLENPYLPGCAEVRLYHPEQGLFSYRNSLKKIVHVSRTEFLRMQYGRHPRTLMVGKEKAGWKNLMLDYGEPDNYAVVRWFPLEMGYVFWQLYEMYRDNVLPGNLPHPYLFVNLSKGPTHGAPYTISNYNLNLKKAVRRIGLEFRKYMGTSSHGLRHGLGQDLEDAKVDPKVIQTCLHQNSINSQETYKLPTDEKANAQLQAGWERLKQLQHNLRVFSI